MLGYIRVEESPSGNPLRNIFKKLEIGLNFFFVAGKNSEESIGATWHCTIQKNITFLKSHSQK